MRRTTSAVLFAASALAATAAPAHAATGSVVIFSTEIQPIARYLNPGNTCQSVPLTSHVLLNLTDSPIKVYADPFCSIPATLPITGLGVLQPGYGTHVVGVGSFSA
jgi:hypothetical protein